MQKYREECARNGTSVNVGEILEEALGATKGYCRGMGPGPKPLKKFKVATQAEVETMKNKLSKADDLIATQTEELRLTREMVNKLKEDQLAMMKQFELTMENFSGSILHSQQDQ